MLVPVRVGDLLQTGPAGTSTFNAGLIVGTVSAVHTSAGGAVTASVRAVVNPTTLNLVGVITSADPTPSSRAPIGQTR